MKRTSIIATLSLLAFSRVAAAQLSCYLPSTCILQHRTRNVAVAVRVRDGGKPVKDRTVVFGASSGALDKLSVATDDSGIAVGNWSGDPSNGEVILTASAEASGAVQSVTFKLGGAYTLGSVLNGANQEWYLKRQLNDSIALRLTIPTWDTCRNAAVIFRTSSEGGSVSLDTAWATGSDSNCVVATHWKLAEYVGQQRLRASLINDPTQRVDVSARSRATPWLGLGLAWFWSARLISLHTEKRPQHFTRKTLSASGADSIEVSYDSSVAVSHSIDTTRAQARFAPVAGVNWPVALKWRNLRLFTAADLADPTHDWYLGASILQLPFLGGWQHESVPIDVQVVLEFNRRDILKNPDECSKNVAACDVVTHTRLYGGGLLVAYNVESALNTLVAALLGK